MQSRKYQSNRTFLALPIFAAFLLAIACGQASAQARYTADRPNPVYVFVEGSRVSPDYGPTENFGFTVGAGYTRHYHLLSPSLEGRITQAEGNVVGEKSYMGGLKGSRAYGHFHPYGEFLVGYGKINFYHPHSPYYHDDSTVYGAGAGLDCDIIGNLGAKAEFQYQTWKLGSANSRLTPTMLNFGLIYHIPVGRR